MIPLLKRLALARPTVVVAFILAHLYLIWTGLKGLGWPMGDIIFAYHPWAIEMFKTHTFMGLTVPWVYPYPNLLFVLLPSYFGPNYQHNWLFMTGTLELAALFVLLFWPRKYDKARVVAGWAWIIAQLLLGPVSISRLDTISVAVAVVGLVAWLRAKPEVAAIWFAIATWIKVWPITILLATVAEARKWRPAAIAGLATGLLVLVAGLIVGGVHNSLSFVLEQTGRGIQIESPWAVPWLWGRIFKFPDTGPYYSSALQTFQVRGVGVMQVAQLLGPLMYLALAITITLGWLVIRRGDVEDTFRRNEVFAWTVLTAILDMIVFNKVGSPQYYCWLIIPVILGNIERVPNWKIVTVWLGLIFGMTGLIYPIIYNHILSSQPWATGVLTIRDVLVVLLLIFSNVRLVELASFHLRGKSARA